MSSERGDGSLQGPTVNEGGCTVEARDRRTPRQSNSRLASQDHHDPMRRLS